jgi:hypothetical protein
VERFWLWNLVEFKSWLLWEKLFEFWKIWWTEGKIFFLLFSMLWLFVEFKKICEHLSWLENIEGEIGGEEEWKSGEGENEGRRKEGGGGGEGVR